MSRKRSVEALYAPSSGDEPKRSKRSPPRQHQQQESPRDSNASASRSNSEASARRRSPTGSRAGQLSRASSPQSSAVEDSEGSLSSSSEDSSSAESGEDGGDTDENEVVTVGGPRKPHMGGRHIMGGAQDLQARISAFLPQLAAANSALGQGPQGLNMEDVEEGEQHIEMNLGLGVLEQVRDDEDDSSSGESQDGDSDSEREEKDTSHMSRLLGQGEARPQVGIEDLG